jgi:hypothetical protein
MLNWIYQRQFPQANGGRKNTSGRKEEQLSALLENFFYKEKNENKDIENTKEN